MILGRLRENVYIDQGKKIMNFNFIKNMCRSSRCGTVGKESNGSSPGCCRGADVTAVAWIQSLAWELPYVVGVAIKKQEGVCLSWTGDQYIPGLSCSWSWLHRSVHLPVRTWQRGSCSQMTKEGGHGAEREEVLRR